MANFVHYAQKTDMYVIIKEINSVMWCFGLVGSKSEKEAVLFFQDGDDRKGTAQIDADFQLKFSCTQKVYVCYEKKLSYIKAWH